MSLRERVIRAVSVGARAWRGERTAEEPAKPAAKSKSDRPFAPTVTVRESPLQIWSDYETTAQVRAAVRWHELGYFEYSTALIRQMLQNPRLRGVVETRTAGLIGTPLRWEPSRNNDAGRRSAAAAEKDWPLIAPEPARRQRHMWGLLAGVAPSQAHWYQSPASGRYINRIEPWSPEHLLADDLSQGYRLMTRDGQVAMPSPALLVPGETWQPQAGGTAAPWWQWVIHEPFGPHSHRFALLMAAWSSWLAHDHARLHRARAAEKLGIGILKLLFPHNARTKGTGESDDAVGQLMRAIRAAGREMVLPLERGLAGGDFDAQPLEWSGTGYDMIERAVSANAVDLAVLFLGHSLSTEAKGASFASADIGNLIRFDIRAFDGVAEAMTDRQQTLGDWAEVNFGDRELAPIAVPELVQPATNLQGAQTISTLAMALPVLAASAPWVDAERLMARFQVPLKPGEKYDLLPRAASAPPAIGNLDAALTRLGAHLAGLNAADPDRAHAAVAGWIQSIAEGAPT